MAKILVTPVASSGVEPFIEEGILTAKNYDVNGKANVFTVYYINGSSYPAEIVTVLED